MLNNRVKWCKNCTFCSALAQFRGKTSCIPWRHSSILKSLRQRWGRSAMSWRQNNGKWPIRIGITWSLFYRASISQLERFYDLHDTSDFLWEKEDIWLSPMTKALHLEQRTIFRQVTIFCHLFLISCNFCIFHRNRFMSFMPMKSN